METAKTPTNYASHGVVAIVALLPSPSKDRGIPQGLLPDPWRILGRHAALDRHLLKPAFIAIFLALACVVRLQRFAPHECRSHGLAVLVDHHVKRREHAGIGDAKKPRCVIRWLLGFHEAERLKRIHAHACPVAILLGGVARVHMQRDCFGVHPLASHVAQGV